MLLTTILIPAQGEHSRLIDKPIPVREVITAVRLHHLRQVEVLISLKKLPRRLMYRVRVTGLLSVPVRSAEAFTKTESENRLDRLAQGHIIVQPVLFHAVRVLIIQGGQDILPLSRIGMRLLYHVLTVVIQVRLTQPRIAVVVPVVTPVAVVAEAPAAVVAVEAPAAVAAAVEVVAAAVEGKTV